VAPQHSDDDARFAAFVHRTDSSERDRLAFAEFEDVITGAAQFAVLSNAYDSSPGSDEEYRLMQIAMAGMFYSVLPKVGLSTVLTYADGIAAAVKYGVLPAMPTALHDVEDVATLEGIADRGWRAEQDEQAMRERQLMAEEEAKASTEPAKVTPIGVQWQDDSEN
jgi:hypothetical protein